MGSITKRQLSVAVMLHDIPKFAVMFYLTMSCRTAIYVCDITYKSGIIFKSPHLKADCVTRGTEGAH